MKTAERIALVFTLTYVCLLILAAAADAAGWSPALDLLWWIRR